jgi:exopolyphosphatase/guanosine-5'-triphosphate,3'-diphosphate pyrophosphatase
LVGNHRRKINNELIEQLPSRWQEHAMYMILILRLAVLINRDRAPKKIPPFKMDADGNQLRIQFKKDWLESRPLTEAEIEQEKSYLKALAIDVHISGSHCITAS